MQHIAQEINMRRERGESTSQMARVYKVYEEEWFKRLAVAWRGNK